MAARATTGHVINNTAHVTSQIITSRLSYVITGTLLQSNPLVKNTFEKFRQMDPMSDFTDSSVFSTHAMVVMSAFEDIFDNLDDSEIVKDILEQGKSHGKFSEDFAPETFWAIEEPFMSSMKDILGRKMSSQLEKIYKKTIKFILSVLIKGLRDATMA
ncbi:hypothetical protein HELRODRAFT_181863 [Helobdella robusta]|uniref:Globin domain-containing protein n=1 Tax=Helobdella robusta TaxID=6412 RepID=T1FHE7_HELRO|nr:hypothetical protein HELRODRAFT_181863 [Helobdella robusta]ESN92082.1 hypothetical protein HELRODRAFT_181863 [Helobdella robusta]